MAISDLFRGRALHAVDARGRVMLPAEFRATVRSRYRHAVHETRFDPALVNPDEHPRGNVAIIVKDPERSCLVGYDDVYANAYAAQIDARHADKNGLERERAIRRDQGFFGASEDVAWDLQGRIVLTPRMRARGGIGRFVYFFARGNTFELWDPVAFDHAHRTDDPDLAEDCRLDCEERGTNSIWSSPAE